MPPSKNKTPATVTFRIDAKLRKRLQKLAEQRHMSEGALVLWLVEQGLINVEDIETRFKTLEGNLSALGGRIDIVDDDISEIEAHLVNQGPIAERLARIERELGIGSDGAAPEQPPSEQEAAAEGGDDDEAEPEDAGDAESGAA